jgi:hypothetical protein
MSLDSFCDLAHTAFTGNRCEQSRLIFKGLVGCFSNQRGFLLANSHCQPIIHIPNAQVIKITLSGRNNSTKSENNVDGS